MIDIENEVFDYFAAAMRAKFGADLYVTGEYNDVPSQFPCVALEEKDNASKESTQAGNSTENHATLLYELNVYSNLLVGKKQQCKDLLAYADGLLAGLGFTRIMSSPVPNLSDTTIYRKTARYRAVVDKNKTFYGR